MPGQLALVIEEEAVVAAVVWETLPPERQLQVAVRLAWLLARIVEAGAMSDRDKIIGRYRHARAVVYVRQSSPGQVQNNHESRALQYALRERAIELGWPAELVAVVDEDPARSGASTDGRLGFKELVAEVGLGRVGLILGIEVSRLARTNADWYRLLDLCTLTGALVADSDGIYCPGNFNDRMLLGLRARSPRPSCI